MLPNQPGAVRSRPDAEKLADFRDHIATADSAGRRKWVYPKKVSGKFYRWRTWFGWFLLAIMLGGPFITIGGNPLLLINLPERRFVVFGQIFWPQDLFIFAIAALLFVVCIIIFTAAFGRLWCGWACPQTVMMEMVFRKIEYLIEGDAQLQRQLNDSPWTFARFCKKLLKHSLFFVMSFGIGNVLLSYIIGWHALLRIVTDPPVQHLVGLGFMLAFSFLFYAIFARFREQACTFICPYGRFQSVLLDENSIVVAYDRARGERRHPIRRNVTLNDRRATGLGDCIDCRQCVSVCPTGIDIRNGTQMECIHCTACMDACDNVMARVAFPRGLIRYASLNGIEHREPLRFTPRLKGYCLVLLVLSCFLGVLIFTRSNLEATMLRAPGSLFQQMPDGRFANLYTIRVLNKTSHDMPVQFSLESPAGTLAVMPDASVVVPGQGSTENSALVELDSGVLKSGTTPVTIGVFSDGKKIQTLKTAFLGPRN